MARLGREQLVDMTAAGIFDPEALPARQRTRGQPG